MLEETLEAELITSIEGRVDVLKVTKPHQVSKSHQVPSRNSSSRGNIDYKEGQRERNEILSSPPPSHAIGPQIPSMEEAKSIMALILAPTFSPFPFTALGNYVDITKLSDKLQDMVHSRTPGKIHEIRKVNLRHGEFVLVAIDTEYPEAILASGVPKTAFEEAWPLHFDTTLQHPIPFNKSTDTLWFASLAALSYFVGNEPSARRALRKKDVKSAAVTVSWTNSNRGVRQHSQANPGLDPKFHSELSQVKYTGELQDIAQAVFQFGRLDKFYLVLAMELDLAQRAKAVDLVIKAIERKCKSCIEVESMLIQRHKIPPYKVPNVIALTVAELRAKIF